MDAVTLRILYLMLTILIFFIISCIMKGSLKIIQKLYIASSSFLIIWIGAVAGITWIEDKKAPVLVTLDAVTCASMAFLVMTMFIMSYCFVHNLTVMPKKCCWLYLFPIVTSTIAFTNPLHHLFYRHFSVYVSEVQFGPLFIISGIQYYFWSCASIFMVLRYGLKNRHKMIVWQVMLFSGGLTVPLIINVLATLKIVDFSIAATPMAFFFTIICHGYAIYFLNFLNIKPVALQNILDSIADCYVILSSDSCIINANQPFLDNFGDDYGMRINSYLTSVVEELEPRKRDVIYNLLNFFDICKQSTSVISYEQAILCERGKLYYSVELTPIFIRRKLVGVVALFADVTKLKEDMRREKQMLSREMERERLASLGQMVGSISHNLKTPIMSVSGSVDSLERLIMEYRESIGDSEVTPNDHAEIAAEMEEWLKKNKGSCAYMSDVITTVKGMAVNMNTSNITEFKLEEVFKKVLILMKQNLIKHRCNLIIENKLPEDVYLKGDVNNLVQVLTNLVDNAKDSMGTKGGDIVLRAWYKEQVVYISVTDSGTGISQEVKRKLFVSMYTSKGAKGTGLGLYSSAGLIRGKFGGEMWVEDNPSGGSVFFVKIPLNT